MVMLKHLNICSNHGGIFFLLQSKRGNVRSMSPAMNEEWWVICKISKEDSHHLKRCDTCKAALSLLKCLFVLLKRTKEFCHLCTYKRTLVMEITRGEGDMGDILMQSACVCLHVLAWCAHLISKHSSVLGEPPVFRYTAVRCGVVVAKPKGWQGVIHISVGWSL